MFLRRALTVAGLTVAATAAVVVPAAPASADGCGTVHVPGMNSVEVCNPVVAAVEDLLELS